MSLYDDLLLRLRQDRENPEEFLKEIARLVADLYDLQEEESESDDTVLLKRFIASIDQHKDYTGRIGFKFQELLNNFGALSQKVNSNLKHASSSGQEHTIIASLERTINLLQSAVGGLQQSVNVHGGRTINNERELSSHTDLISSLQSLARSLQQSINIFKAHSIGSGSDHSLVSNNSRGISSIRQELTQMHVIDNSCLSHLQNDGSTHQLVSTNKNDITAVQEELTQMHVIDNSCLSHLQGVGSDHSLVSTNKNDITTLQGKLENIATGFIHGTHETVGGAASEDITITGVTADMSCMVQFLSDNPTVSIENSLCDAGKITVKFSADPGATHTVKYLIYE